MLGSFILSQLQIGIKDSKMPRFIPKLVFQIIALTLLAVGLVLMLYWIVTDSGLYRQIDGMINGRSQAIPMLVTFFAVFIGWIIVVVPIRLFSHMPTMKEELGADFGDGLPSVMTNMKRVYKEQSLKNDEMYRAETYTPEMRQRARMLGVAFIIIGVMLALTWAWSLVVTLESGYLTKFQIALLIIAPAFFFTGLYQVITGKSAIKK